MFTATPAMFNQQISTSKVLNTSMKCHCQSQVIHKCRTIAKISIIWCIVFDIDVSYCIVKNINFFNISRYSQIWYSLYILSCTAWQKRKITDGELMVLYMVPTVRKSQGIYKYQSAKVGLRLRFGNISEISRTVLFRAIYPHPHSIHCTQCTACKEFHLYLVCCSFWYKSKE